MTATSSTLSAMRIIWAATSNAALPAVGSLFRAAVTNQAGEQKGEFMDAGTKAELARRAAKGLLPMSLRDIENSLRFLGYALDRRCDSYSVNRIMTGPHAGENYQAVNLYVVEADTGRSFAHKDSRRDARYNKLQRLRFSERVFAVENDRIYQI